MENNIEAYKLFLELMMDYVEDSRDEFGEVTVGNYCFRRDLEMRKVLEIPEYIEGVVDFLN